MNLANIPAELRALPQWVCANLKDATNPKRPIDPKTGKPASVSDPTTWSTFEEAAACAREKGWFVGFVITAGDPYVFIDLDWKENLSEAEQKAQKRILDNFPTYTERSVSGKGLHLALKGQFEGAGRHRGSIEVYREGRYMICTGDIVHSHLVPITELQPQLDQLISEMPEYNLATDALDDAEETISDRELVERASNAANGPKFDDLCAGRWQGVYPSQSEADLALIKIISIYTRSNEQVRRIFRMSALGKREKAVRDNRYLNFTLGKARGAEPPPVDISELTLNAVSLAESTPEPVTRPLNGLPYPEGLVGRLAQFFYQTAVRPVPEIGLLSSIAFVAGVAGRSYNISNSGLNQYLVLLAKTGSGKESIASGIDLLLSHIRPTVPSVDQVIGPAVFSSGPSILRYLSKKSPCFVSVLGEFGLTLRALSDPRSNALNTLLKRVLLDVYSKSGWQSILRSSVYSDSDKNTDAVQAPNITILGESTPEAFYDGLDPSHVAEGLIPRFSVIEYDGPRPGLNAAAFTPPPPDLVQETVTLVVASLTAVQNSGCIAIATQPSAQSLLDDFNRQADLYINEANGEVERMIWNRAHLKALKLAGLLAVGNNAHLPVVTQALAEWAIHFVQYEATAMTTRFQSGDVGLGDSKQLNDLRRTISKYLSGGKCDPGTPPEMFDAKLVPYRLILRRTAGLASFRQDRLGATSALKRSLAALVDSGDLVQLAANTVHDKYQFNGIVYGVSKGWRS